MTHTPSERLIWRNVRLATLDPRFSQPYGLVEHHALLVRDGRIEAIVPESEAPAGQSIDLGGRLLTPGLIDCHTHWSSAAAERRSGAAPQRRLLPDH